MDKPERDLLKELQENRHKAEEMLIMAETVQGDMRRICLEMAESYCQSAQLIATMKQRLRQ